MYKKKYNTMYILFFVEEHFGQTKRDDNTIDTKRPHRKLKLKQLIPTTKKRH